MAPSDLCLKVMGQAEEISDKIGVAEPVDAPDAPLAESHFRAKRASRHHGKEVES